MGAHGRQGGVGGPRARGSLRYEIDLTSANGCRTADPKVQDVPYKSEWLSRGQL